MRRKQGVSPPAYHWNDPFWGCSREAGSWQIRLIRRQIHHTFDPHSKGLLSYPWACLPLTEFYSAVRLLVKPQGRQGPQRLHWKHTGAPLGRPSFTCFHDRSGALALPRQLGGSWPEGSGPGEREPLRTEMEKSNHLILDLPHQTSELFLR